MVVEYRHAAVHQRDAIALEPDRDQLSSENQQGSTFKGVFIGIDRHATSAINWLSCAERDATALHALFSDTLGGDAVLLVDEAATHQAIQEQLLSLTTCKAEDLVVVAFSGHGTSTHQLITFDTEPSNLECTSVSLEWLADLLSRIPARRVICFLDCCFSGGANSKAFQVETVARDLQLIDSALSQLSGEGRIILTASGSTEPAYENVQLEHGLLTYYLLEAFQGGREVEQSGKLALYALLQYVTRRVIDASQELNKPQTPTLRGHINGEVLLPVFVPGNLYRAAFPERSHPEVTADIQSLAAYGFPEALLRTWATIIPCFNALQLAAINDFEILEGQHLVVSAPTSSGKTTIGEIAALRSILSRKRALFLLPLKALVNDKLRAFEQTYGSSGIITVQATGETDDITSLLRGQYDICLLTYEKFAAVVLTNPHILEQVGTVVIDEVQMIADKSRGVNLEFILTLLRVRRQQKIEPQIIALSAVIGNTNGLEDWLGARLLFSEDRPIPLDEGVLLSNGRFRFIDGDSGEEKITEPLFQPDSLHVSSRDYLIPLIQKLLNEGKQVIVFRETKPEALFCARYLAGALGLPPAQAAVDALPVADASKASEELKSSLQFGVAFHSSELAPEERQIIEEQFRANNTTLRVIVATTTLAMGVNTPASAVIAVGLAHPGPKGSSTPYAIAEYKNMAGRAGRLQQSERGTSYLIPSTPGTANRRPALADWMQYYHRWIEDAWTYYVKGKAESLISQFLSTDTDPRSLILRTIAASEFNFNRRTVDRASQSGIHADDLVNFLEASFGAFQQMRSTQHWKWDRTQLSTSLQSLLHHRLVDQDSSGYYHLTPLGRLAGEAGVEVESIVRLVACLMPLTSESIHEPTLLAATQITVELDQQLFPINWNSTNKEPNTWNQELLQQQIPHTLLDLLHRFATDRHQGTLRTKKAVACLLFVTNRPTAEIESVLTQFRPVAGGAAGAIRDVANRTCDLLPVVAQVARILHPSLDLDERVSRLLVRLSVGVPPDAIDLARQTGNRLTRGDYLQLLEADLCSIDNIESASDSTLLEVLNQNKDKLELIRKAVKLHRQRELEIVPILPILAPFES